MTRHLCIALTIILVVVGTNSARSSGSSVTVTLRNAGAFDSTYELYDNVCATALPDVSIPAHGTQAQTICASAQGYGSFKSRIKGNTTWNNHDLLSSGQVVD